MKDAKIYAAHHDTTINSLVRELLQARVSGDARTGAAAERFLALADRGPYFTADPASIRREKLYERQ